MPSGGVAVAQDKKRLSGGFADVEPLDASDGKSSLSQPFDLKYCQLFCDFRHLYPLFFMMDNLLHIYITYRIHHSIHHKIADVHGGFWTARDVEYG